MNGSGEVLTPELSYAPRGRWRWRLSRRYVIVAALAALAIVAWRWSPSGMRIAHTAYWSRQCTRYAPPADQVVFEQDPNEIARLMSSGAGYRVSGAGEGDPPHAWLSPAPYGYIPQSGWSPRVAFMHGLRPAGGGAERLVVVELLAMRHTEMPRRHTVFFHPRVFSASMLRPGRELRRYDDTARISLADDERLRLFAGRPDPHDASRFTIECLIAGERGTIEGRILDDNAVTLRPFSGDALKQRWRTVGPKGWWDYD